MAQYIHPALPTGISVHDGVVEFFDAFYRTSDNPTAHDVYARSFTPDATFILGPKKSEGYAQIHATREGMWASVASRHHSVSKIFPFGSDAQEFMLYGQVKYTSKTGEQSDKEWSARAILEKDTSGQWKFRFYQVYLA